MPWLVIMTLPDAVEIILSMPQGPIIAGDGLEFTSGGVLPIS